MHIAIYDDFLDDPDQHVKDILKGTFADLQLGPDLFRGIQLRAIDSAAYKLRQLLPGYHVAHNFVRRSPLGQPEPHLVHTDEMMGDVTALLYLCALSPEQDGTTLYDSQGRPKVNLKAAYNRLVVFDAKEPHSRNIVENFGEGKDARLVQVMFLREV